MNNQTTATPMQSTSHNRGAFRLTYTDLYPGPDVSKLDKAMNPCDMVRATSEFPVLNDRVCKLIIVSGTLDRLEQFKVDPLNSAVGMQGWVERYARACGYAGMPVPTGRVNLWVLRGKCLLRSFRAVADDVFSRS